MNGRFTRLSSVALAALTAAALLSVVPATPASAATITVPLRTAVANLPVAAEIRDGYSRDLFPLWIDADGDGCNTRYEVLIAEAVNTPNVGSGCTLTGGKWYSYYDGAYWTQPSDIDIDHMVPLAEAWDSGARNWTTDKRKAYANDLGDPRPLAAVTDNVNQAKSDKDPADWLPPLASVKCRYVNEWVAVKTRWGLTVDSREKNTLTNLAAGCPNVDITVDVVGGGGTPPPDACGPFSNNTSVAIPDPGIVTSSISVSGCTGSASSSSKIAVDISHTWRGDLSIYLYAPDGTYYVLKTSSSSDSADNVKTTYTANLSSEARNGTWKLSVKDYVAPDAGTINSWTITL